MNIIQAYAPTCDKSDDMIEEFYSDLEKAMCLTKKGEITIVLGDFNAKIGKNATKEISGHYGLGERNARGERLIQFCAEHHLSAVNTFFKQHPRRLYTWKSPADREGHIIRNQIDFILIRNQLMKYVKTVSTYPGADVDSDHNPVVMDLKLRRFVKIKRSNSPRRIDIKRLADPAIRALSAENLEARLQKADNSKKGEIEPQWNMLKKALIDTQVTDIGYIQVVKKQQWMTDKILQLMDKRREQKARNIDRYKELNKEVRRACRRAKECWLAEKCSEIETLRLI